MFFSAPPSFSGMGLSASPRHPSIEMGPASGLRRMANQGLMFGNQFLNGSLDLAELGGSNVNVGYANPRRGAQGIRRAEFRPLSYGQMQAPQGWDLKR